MAKGELHSFGTGSISEYSPRPYFLAVVFSEPYNLKWSHVSLAPSTEGHASGVRLGTLIVQLLDLLRTCVG